MEALVAPILALSLAACAQSGAARAPSSPRGIVRKSTPDEVDTAASRERAGERSFPWAAWTPETFERARREGHYLLSTERPSGAPGAM